MAGPARCQLPPAYAKIPATPGAAHWPASSGSPDRLNAAAVRLLSLHERPAGVAARDVVLASRVQPVPPGSDISARPRFVSATSLPPGPAASADGTAARPAGSRPGTQCAPPSRVTASGENVRSWLGLKPAAMPPPPSEAPTSPPLSATPGGVASDHFAAPAGRVISCQKFSCSAADPPMSTTAQLAPPGPVREVTSGSRIAAALARAGVAAAVLPQPAASTAVSAAASRAARGDLACAAPAAVPAAGPVPAVALPPAAAPPPAAARPALVMTASSP